MPVSNSLLHGNDKIRNNLIANDNTEKEYEEKETTAVHKCII